jgi:predicted nucleotidyltransferase
MSLLSRYEDILTALIAELRATYGPRLVACAVFGSVGRGTPRADSDVDLLLVVRDLPRGRFARLDEFVPVEARLERSLRGSRAEPAIALSPVFKTPDEVLAGSPLFLDMVDDARILHDPTGFLGQAFGRLRARLAELGARRVWRGNAWYWELKPDLRPGEVFTL